MHRFDKNARNGAGLGPAGVAVERLEGRNGEENPQTVRRICESHE